MLTARELELYFVYEHTSEEFNIRGSAISLEDLAKTTHEVPFEPRRRRPGTPVSPAPGQAAAGVLPRAARSRRRYQVCVLTSAIGYGTRCSASSVPSSRLHATRSLRWNLNDTSGSSFKRTMMLTTDTLRAYVLSYVLIRTEPGAVFGQRQDYCPSARKNVRDVREEERREVAGNAALNQRFPQPHLWKLRISCSATELPRRLAHSFAPRPA